MPRPQEMTAIAGRSSRSSLARPGSAEPWWATLRISTRRREQPRGDVRLGVRGQQGVDLAVASRAARRRAGSDPPSAFRPGPARGRGAGAGRAGTRRPRASRRPRRPRSAAAASAAPLVRARRGEARVEHAVDREPAEHGLSAADVVALRVREHERGEPPDAEAAKLLGDVRLRRPLVDEDRALGHLEQDRVALPDVEERDPEARRRRQPSRRDRAARRAAPARASRAHASASRAAPARQPLQERGARAASRAERRPPRRSRSGRTAGRRRAAHRRRCRRRASRSATRARAPPTAAAARSASRRARARAAAPIASVTSTFASSE